MRSIPPVTAVAFALAAVAFASPAAAQYDRVIKSSDPAPAPAATPAPTTPSVASFCPLEVSKGSRAALVALQTKVNARDVASIAAADAAARAVARTPTDRCVLAQMQWKAAIDRKDYSAAQAALEAIVASGVMKADVVAPEVTNLGKLRYNAKDFAGALGAFQLAQKLSPNSAEPYVLAANTRVLMGQGADALAMYRKGFALQAASGVKVEEAFLKNAIALAIKTNSPDLHAIMRDWVAAYPTPANWRDALTHYSRSTGLGEPDLLDVRRLQRAVGGLAGEAEFGLFALALSGKGYAGEAAAMLKEAWDGAKIPRTPSLSATYAKASAKATTDRATLDAKTAAGLAGPTAAAAMTAGDLNYGFANYARAAELYRAALGKTGVDSSLANLRLGMALTMAGDKAAAKAALEAATGRNADIARYWLIYLAQRP